MLLGPSPRVAAHGIVAALIATPAELLKDPDQRQLLATGLGRVELQQLVELGRPPPELRPRLNDPLVLERRLPRAQHLADRVTRYPEIPGDSLMVLPLTKCSRRIRAMVSTISIPRPSRFESKREVCNDHTSGGQFWTPIPRL